MNSSEATEAGWRERPSGRKARSVEAEASLVHVEKVGEEPRAVIRYGLGFILTLLLVLPLAFGGVHPAVYGPAEIGLFALTALLFFTARAETITPLTRPSMYRSSMIAAVTLLTYLIVRGIVGIALPTEGHPVLGLGIQRAEVLNLVAWVREVVVFLAVVVSTRTILTVHRRSFELLSLAIVITGVIIALVGLAHWFYDNGRLFWFFEPENVFISERARWPFVNSNNLACFLIPAFFLLTARCLNGSHSLRGALMSQRTGRMKPLADLASDDRVQRKVVRLAFDGVMGITVLLCIIATLSRGVWFGTVVGLTLFFILDFVSQPKGTPASNLAVSQAPEERRKRSHSGRRRRSGGGGRAPLTPSPKTLRMLRVGALAIGCLLVYLFLRDRGAELVEARIEYGLLHSKEDMRFQLLEDSWPLIAAHPWFGLGIDRWAEAYATVMSPRLAGIVPVYLHNEPLQLLAETGIVGLLLVAWSFSIPLFRGIKGVKGSPERFAHIGLLSALAATLLATVFDFHLRMPAVVFQLAVLLSLIIELSDREPGRAGKGESNPPSRSS